MSPADTAVSSASQHVHSKHLLNSLNNICQSQQRSKSYTQSIIGPVSRMRTRKLRQTLCLRRDAEREGKRNLDPGHAQPQAPQPGDSHTRLSGWTEVARDRNPHLPVFNFLFLSTAKNAKQELEK